MDVPVSQQKILAIVPEIIAALGDIPQFGRLSEQQRQAAEKVIDEKLIASGSQWEKLEGCMLKAFLMSFPTYISLNAKKVQEEMERFINAAYNVTDGNNNADHDYRFRDLQFLSARDYDGFSCVAIIRDELKNRPEWKEFAEIFSKQAAFFIKKDIEDNTKSNYHTLLFDKFHVELAKIGMESPLKQIEIVEIGGSFGPALIKFKGGSEYRRLAELVGALNKIFGKYEAVGAIEHEGKKQPKGYGNEGLIYLQSPGPLKDKKCKNIIAANVLADRALKNEHMSYSEEHPCRNDPSYWHDNLLCTLANALEPGGQLYVHNSYADGANYIRDRELLRFAGLSVAQKKEGGFLAGNHSYVLQKSPELRAEPVSVDELDRFYETKRRGTDRQTEVG